MRYVITIVLSVLLGFTHYQLWFGGESNGAQLKTMQRQLGRLQSDTEQLKIQNEGLQAELDDLATGTLIIEDHARSELGMIKKDEVLVIFQ